MVSSIIDFLREGGIDVETASYKSYREAPALSVPSWSLLFRSPQREEKTLHGCLAHDIGVRLPELEWAHYLPSRLWRQAMDRCDVHLTVSGSVLAAGPIVESGRPCLAWVATPYWEDRMDRTRTFHPMRRIVDALFDAPVCVRWERRLLEKASILALSGYTERMLRRAAPKARIRRMYAPIRTDLFHPSDGVAVAGKIGFSGRFDDPRKNIFLLLEAVALACRAGAKLSLVAVGARPSQAILRQVEALGMTDRFSFVDRVPYEKLGEFYRSLDLFVIPSLQEGLGIVGLEAMACGCPVVSTRCGGPEDYVRDGDNGFLTGFSGDEMSEMIRRVVSDRALRQRLSRGAVETTRQEFSPEAVKAVFWESFQETFGN